MLDRPTGGNLSVEVDGARVSPGPGLLVVTRIQPSWYSDAVSSGVSVAQDSSL